MPFPGLNYMLCNYFCVKRKYLQTTMDVSIFISNLFIHPDHHSYPSTFLVCIVRA